MITEEILFALLALLEECGLSYMITGSFAGNVHGIPRATQDADVVISADRQNLENLLDAAKDNYYISREAVFQALEGEGMFNVIHLETGFKVDLIVKKKRPFSQEEFSRRRQLSFLGRPLWFASPEDVILSKLEWSKMGGSERQFQDALNVARVQGKDLDIDYLRKWAAALGVQDMLGNLIEGMED